VNKGGDMKRKVKKTISYEEYLKLEGLMVLARDYHKKADEVERVMADSLSDDPNRDDNYGLWSDYMFDDRPVKELLKNLDIKINKVPSS